MFLDLFVSLISTRFALTLTGHLGIFERLHPFVKKVFLSFFSDLPLSYYPKNARRVPFDPLGSPPDTRQQISQDSSTLSQQKRVHCGCPPLRRAAPSLGAHQLSGVQGGHSRLRALHSQHAQKSR